MPPPRVYLIDGSSYVYRAFYALPPLSSPSGMPTNAVYGFTTMTLKLLDEVKPQYLAVVFDAPGATFRDDLFTEYKANRPPTPPDLAGQIDMIHRIVAAMRICDLTMPGVEADDVIATLTTRYAAQGIDCVVISMDKDLMQLVGPHVKLWDTMRNRWIDEAGVEERLGVKPSQVVDVMALMGDPIDNIPGVKGIGEKTAVALIRTFGSLDNVLARLDEVEKMELRGAKKVAALLRAGAEAARLSRALATVRRDVPIDRTLEQLGCGRPDHAELRRLFTQLGFQSLIRQLSARAPALQVRASVRAPSEVAARLERVRRDGWVSLVTLCEAGPTVTARATEVVLCGSEGCAERIVLDDAARGELCATLAAPGFKVISHDLKRDLHALAAAGIAVHDGIDLMIVSYLLEASATHRLEDLAADVLGVHLAAFRDGVEGAAAGVTLLRRLWDELAPQLHERGLVDLFERVEMPLLHVLARMERRGIVLDVARLRALGEEYSARMERLVGEIYELAGGEFNLNSPPQLREVLFDRLQLSKKGVRRGKTGYSTDVDVLTRLAREHPLPARILEYRALAKLKSTYVDALPAAVHPATGRLHTSFNQTVAATGRLSSSDPNLQNIPARGEEGRRIRECFVAPPGYVLIAADYSQIELRVLAHLSRDPALVDAFTHDQDIHTRTAAEVFGVLPGAVSADMRRAAKVINFGIIYGMGPQRLAAELGVPFAEAQRYIASYFTRYSGVRRFMESVIDDARQCGYVTTIMGRRRAVPELRSADRNTAQAAERAAMNSPIQGSAADLIKLAMVAIDRRLAREAVDAALILQVHDELLFEAAEKERDAVIRLVREEMEGVAKLAVPLRVDIGCGRSWAEAH